MPTDSAESHPPNALPRGTLLHAKFRLKEVLGVGGFGIVYLAHDEYDDVEVAIKEYMPASLAGRTGASQVSLTSQSNAETFAIGLKSFRNEARLLARFRNERLPLLKVYESFEANNTAYMVMPVLRGRTAQQVRRDTGKPPSERRLRKLITDLLPALEKLHSENVFHRDISPDNIQIDDQGDPVLMDLGAARHVIGDRTQSITAILKPGYAPIEQYGESTKLKQGPWTDLYALGATVHYMIHGKAPDSATARIFDPGTPLASQSIPGFSAPFLQTIDWMLAPKPEDRPQSIAQLRAALDDSVAVTRIMAPVTAPKPAPVASAARTSAPPTVPVPPAAVTAETTVVAAPRSRPPTQIASAAPPSPSPLLAAETASEALISLQARIGRLPLPLVLAGVAVLVVAGAAAALWPRQTSPTATAARQGAASQPEKATLAPVTDPRPTPTTTPTPVTATPLPATPPVAAVETLPAPPPAAAPPAPAPAPPATTSAVAKQAPSGAPAATPDNEQTQTLAAVPTKRASAPVAASAPGKKPVQVNDRDGALLPRPAEPAAQTAAAPAPAPAPPPLAPTPVAAPPTPAAPTEASPSERCSDKSGIGLRLCIGVVCGLPSLHNHPECVAIRRR